MPADKYTAVWVSHSSMSDYLKCPRSYFLKNVYRNPETGRKVQIATPQLSLGQAVHNTLEALSVLPTDKRFLEPLIDRFDTSWKKVSGKKGGFFDEVTENTYRERGRVMIERVHKNPGPLKNLAVKIHMDIPNYWLSEEENIILCGKLDWLEYDQATDSVSIIDFKTSKSDESKESMQLPIYCLLAQNTQKRKVTGASYWYLERNDEPTPVEIPDLLEAEEKILKIARQIKVARQLERFKCEHGGCNNCKPFEAIIDGRAELVGSDETNREIYVLREDTAAEDVSEIL
jgi:ATP-dependent helicase/DNAse subunit B